MSQPTLTTKPDPLLHRPPSALSVASNSSAASGSSLARRSRARARSKTMAADVRNQEGSHDRSPSSELPYLDRTLVQDHSPNPSSLETLALPPKGPSPSRPPHRSDTGDGFRGTVNSLQQNEREPIGNQPLQGFSTAVNATESKPAQLDTMSQVPFPDVEPVFSTFYRPPSLTRIKVRDSVLTHNSDSTQQSGTSSSLYPPSTSTASGTESPPSPRSMALQEDDYDIEPMVDEPEGYEGDDVSYRLRLLVKNNYFLPPAHSKPSPSDFASAAALSAGKRPTRATTPTFLDLFKVGKSKTRPATSLGAAEGLPPMLRTAADSPTASAYVNRPQPRSSAQIPRVPQQPGNIPRQPSGRVVVVREKMSDLTVAAKQSEQEMKNRGTRREEIAAEQERIDDVIDPTDVVDLPPPASSYPFAVQASAFHGLGVQDSLGAAVLADRLPPPRSLDVSSSFDTDESWRKALLQQAVHHSLDTSPDISSFSMLGATSTPIASPRTSGQMTSRGPSPSAKRILDQHILSPRIVEKEEEDQGETPGRRQSSQSHRSNKAPAPLHLTPAIPETQSHSARSSYLPLRVDTPIALMTPLTPPPRRLMINPTHSQSQTNLPRTPLVQEIPRPASATPPIRRTKSSPMLSDSYEHNPKRDTLFTPPPLPATTTFYRVTSQDIFGLSSSSGNTSFDSAREHLPAPSITTSESRYSVDSYVEDIDRGPRVSMALSAMNERPSLSEYSQASPSVSSFTFPEMSNNRTSMASTVPGSARASVEQPVFQTSTPRSSVTSPPPRVSSSLAHFALSPPPRPGQTHRRFSPQLSAPASSADRRVSPNSPLRNDAQIFAPEPTTPPLPIAERRNTRTPPALTLPTTDIPVAIHSAPGPSSPTSFFDTIQSQPNAMDDLESSSDESEDEHTPNNRSIYDDDRGPTNLFVDPRTRAISNITSTTPRPNIVLRLGNHSSPHIARSPEARRPSLPFGVKDPKKPIEFTPSKPQYFTEMKSDHGHGLPSPLDSTKSAQQYNVPRPGESGSSFLAPTSRRPTVTEQRENVKTWQSSQRAQESLRRLDGMLIQHMEAEKDTIKRIATTLRSTSASTTASRT